MNATEAKNTSKQVIDSHWADWLTEEIQSVALSTFQGSVDDQDLRRARILFDTADVVNMIIKTNAGIR